MGDSSLRPTAPSLPRLLGVALLSLCAVIAQGCGADEPEEVGYIASSARVPFHVSTCKRVRRIPEEKLVVFEDRDSALAANHVPCLLCRP